MTFGWVDHFGNKKDILMKHGEKDGMKIQWEGMICGKDRVIL